MISACSAIVRFFVGVIFLTSFFSTQARAIEATDADETAVSSENSGVSTAPAPVLSSVRTSPNHFSFGAEYSRFTYIEPGLMTDSGWMYGINGRYERAVAGSSFKVALESSIDVGGLDYTGETWAGTPLTSKTADLIFNFRPLLSYDFATSRGTFTPFAGLGFRYLNDNGQDSSSYEREISYYYLPIGSSFDVAATNRLSWGGALEYDYFIHGTVNTHLDQFNSQLPDLYNSQSSGEGSRVSAHLVYRALRAVVRFEPYWQHWAVDASDSKIIMVTSKGAQWGTEPRNSSDQVGLNLSVAL